MNKALFLDRDGIINIDHGYVFKKEEFEFVDGIFELCQQASALGYLIIVITNQSGIARGLYSETEFLDLTQWMKTEFTKHGTVIQDVFYCPHHPTIGVNGFKQVCNCRKPAPELILIAQKKYNICLKDSVFVGDKISDMAAAQNAGIKNRILVSTQHEDNDKIQVVRIEKIKQAIQYLHD